MQSLQTASIIHTHTQAQIYTFSHASPPFSFSRPHPLFLLFNTRTHAQINTHTLTHSLTATMIPAHGTDAQFAWTLENKVSLAKPENKYVACNFGPILPKAKTGVFIFFFPAATMMTRSVSFCDKALHDQSPARLFWKGLRHCFYLELAPAIIYITQHGTITHSASVF